MPPTQATFRDLIADNKRKSAMLVIVFCLLVAAVVMVLGLAILAYLSPDSVSELNWRRALVVGAIAGGISFLIAMLGYFQGDSLILATSGAKEIQHADDPVYLIDDPAPNAFATGRDPQHAAVAITTGLRTKLTRDELQGVIAHEMGHIRNYDIRLMLLMAVLVGTVVMLADFFWQIVWYSPGGRSSSRKGGRDSGGGIVAVVLVVVAILLAWRKSSNSR